MNADDRAGIDWWNGLTDAARAYRLAQAGGAAKLASVADAWAACKASGATSRSVAEGQIRAEVEAEAAAGGLAASWHDRVIDAMNDAQDTGATIGLSIDGALHVLPPPPTQ